MARIVQVSETVWRLVRQPAVTTGARAAGDADVQSQPGGLWFYPDQGRGRFLPLDSSELPSEQEVASASMEQVVNWMDRARER